MSRLSETQRSSFVSDKGAAPHPSGMPRSFLLSEQEADLLPLLPMPGAQWNNGVSFLLTVAGPQRILTAFPIKPFPAPILLTIEYGKEQMLIYYRVWFLIVK